jgi:hypothetical protein
MAEAQGRRPASWRSDITTKFCKSYAGLRETENRMEAIAGVKGSLAEGASLLLGSKDLLAEARANRPLESPLPTSLGITVNQRNGGGQSGPEASADYRLLE